MVVLTSLVFWPGHCIQMKPGEPTTARETPWCTACSHCGSTAEHGGVPGVWVVPTPWGHPWYGSGCPVSLVLPCFKAFWLKTVNFGKNREFRQKPWFLTFLTFLTFWTHQCTCRTHQCTCRTQCRPSVGPVVGQCWSSCGSSVGPVVCLKVVPFLGV